MKFLVIGNAIRETVTRSEDQATRSHIGGVGAIMARELSLAGADTTFLTTASTEDTKAMKQALERGGIRQAIVMPGHPPQRYKGHINMTARKGNSCKVDGKWPYMGQLLGTINEMAPDYDWTLISMNLRTKDLESVYYNANRVAVNATSKASAHRIAIIPNQHLYTMNEPELNALAKELEAGGPAHVRESLGAQVLMLTKGKRGRTIYQEKGPPLDVNALPVPKGTDFIGAGDAATAGLVYAMAFKQDQTETVDRFIQNLMARNARAYDKIPA